MEIPASAEGEGVEVAGGSRVPDFKRLKSSLLQRAKNSA